MTEFPDRRKVQFNEAVREAAAAAAQQVAQIHRRRLVIQSFIAALVVSAAVAVVGLLVVSSGDRALARQNAVYDCHLFQAAANAVGDFVSSDAALRTRQNEQGLGKELSTDFQKIIRQSTLLRLAHQQQQDVSRTVAVWKRDARTLLRLGGTDCAEHLSG